MTAYEERSSAPPYFHYRSAALFCAPMIVNGVALPYFPVWLDSIKMNAAEISTILAVPMVLRVLVAPVVSMLSDRLGDRANVLVWLASLSLLTAVVLFWTSSFWPIAVIFGLQGAFYAPFVPVTESILLTGVRRWGFDYGRMRLWGSLAFIAATTFAGIAIGENGGHMVLPAMTGGFVLMILASFLAPRTGKAHHTTAIKTTQKSALVQLDFILLLIGASLSQSSHAMLFAFASIDWGRMGFSGTEIGLFWSAGVLAEVFVFLFARHLSRKYSIWMLIYMGIGMAIVRWCLFPLHGGFTFYLVLQCFHGFTFGTAHLGIQNAIVNRVAPAQEASAQGLYFFFNGGSMAVATFLSGFFYVAYGIHGYYFMAAASVLGLVFVTVSRLLQPQS